jgi:tetratricopeptide (TPR) repeat protein
VCRQTHDEIGEGLACSALAAAHQNANELERSIKFLEENFALARRTNQLDAQATACCNLGVIYNKNGDFQRAAQYFEQFFALAQKIGDPRMLDIARVHLGVAKGNIKLAEFASKAASCPTSDDVMRLLRDTFGTPLPVH